MNSFWQNLIVTGLVSAAGAYLTYRTVRVFRRNGQTGCGSCPDCSVHDSSEPSGRSKPLVPLDLGRPE